MAQQGLVGNYNAFLAFLALPYHRLLYRRLWVQWLAFMGVESLKLCHIRCVASHFGVQFVVLILLWLRKPRFEVALVAQLPVANAAFSVGCAG